MKNEHKFKFKTALLLGTSLAVIQALFWISPIFNISHNKYKSLFNIFNLDWNLGLAMYINK